MPLGRVSEADAEQRVDRVRREIGAGPVAVGRRDGGIDGLQGRGGVEVVDEGRADLAQQRLRLPACDSRATPSLQPARRACAAASASSVQSHGVR